MKLRFFTPSFAAFAKNLIVSKIKGVGKLNFDGELLPIKYSDFMFNLPKVYIDNACYVSVSYVGLFYKIYSGLMKWIALNKTA